MFGVSNAELLLFLVIAIFILGPKETMIYIKKFKRFIQKIKAYNRDLDRELEQTPPKPKDSDGNQPPAS